MATRLNREELLRRLVGGGGRRLANLVLCLLQVCLLDEGVNSRVCDILRTRVYLGNYSETLVIMAGLRGAFELLRNSLEDGGASSMGREILESAKMSLQVLMQLKVLLIVASCNISRAPSKEICCTRRRLHDIPGF